MLLTPARIEAQKPKDKPFELFDPSERGLCLRVLPSGAKVFRYRARALHKTFTLGTWAMQETPGFVTLHQAREWCSKLKAARRGGPEAIAAVEAQLRAVSSTSLASRPPVGGLTVGQLAERFMAKKISMQRKRPEVAQYMLTKDILPELGSLPLAAIKKSHVRALIEKVNARGATTHSGKVLALVNQLLDYGEATEDDFSNPAARLKASDLGCENNMRTRWLNADELTTWWRALDPDEPGVNARSVPEPATAAALRLLLLTIVRSSELRLAKWSEVDVTAATWTIPVENQKLTLKAARFAKPFVVPLTSLALEQFAKLRELAGESRYVVPMLDDSDRPAHTSRFGKAQRRLWRTHLELALLPEACVHDLRRTARSWLGALGVAPHIAERCLNHKLGGRIMQTYDRGDYLAERRAALELWSAKIYALLSPADSKIAFLENAG